MGGVASAEQGGGLMGDSVPKETIMDVAKCVAALLPDVSVPVDYTTIRPMAT